VSPACWDRDCLAAFSMLSYGADDLSLLSGQAVSTPRVLRRRPFRYASVSASRYWLVCRINCSA
jgi:hypothetical protein